MEKNLERRIALKFCLKIGKNVTETFQMLNQVYGESVMSFGSVFWRHGKFSFGSPRSIKV